MENVETLKCQGCGVSGPTVERRRQNTAYHNDALNWSTLCGDCQKDADEYWNDRWQEYWAGCL